MINTMVLGSWEAKPFLSRISEILILPDSRLTIMIATAAATRMPLFGDSLLAHVTLASFLHTLHVKHQN